MTIQLLAFKGSVQKTSSGQQHLGGILDSRFQNNSDSVSFSGKDDKKSKLRQWAAALALPLALGSPNALANKPGDSMAQEAAVERSEGLQKAQYYQQHPDVTSGLRCIRDSLERGVDINITSNPDYYGKFYLNNRNNMIFFVRQRQTGDEAAFLVDEYQGVLVSPMKYLANGELQNFNYHLNDALGRFDSKFHCEDGQVKPNSYY